MSKSRRQLNGSRPIILCQGQFKIPFRREPDTIQSMTYAPSSILSSHYELSDFLSNLHALSCSIPSIFQAYSWIFRHRSLLHRFFGTLNLTGLEAFRNPVKVISILRLVCLLWILRIFLEHAQSPLELVGELQYLQIRLSRHGLDRFGSPMILCWLLLREEDILELHPRSWVVVRLINIIKVWNVSRQHKLTTLLYGYLLCDEASEAQQQQHYSVMKEIMDDLTTLTAHMTP